MKKPLLLFLTMGNFYYCNAIAPKETNTIFLTQCTYVLKSVNSYPLFYTILKNYTRVSNCLRELKSIAVRGGINSKCYLYIFACKIISPLPLLPLWFEDG
jgi:hypothetical protein